MNWVLKLGKAHRVPVVEYCECASADEALAMEAALISALWRTGDLFNRIQGRRQTRFRPVGLPKSLRSRIYSDPLTRDDLRAFGGAIVVYIGPTDFADDVDGVRVGARPRLALSDHDVSNRISKWWQLGRYREQWISGESAAPRLLLGVTGPQRVGGSGARSLLIPPPGRKQSRPKVDSGRFQSS